MTNILSLTVAWVAIATGIIGLLALAFIILFFAIGQPFGTLNDICIGLTAVSSVVLAWMSYSEFHSPSPLTNQLALIAAIVGAFIVVRGAVLVIFGITGWYLAGLYMVAGNALIGLWLLGLNYSALQNNALPQNLIVFGFIVGGLMALGLVAMPGIFNRIDSWDAAPWYINYIGQAGGLGYLVLYPFWCIFLGRTLL